MSYRYRDKRRFQSKIANFPHPGVFIGPAEGFPLGIGYRRSVKKLEWWGYRRYREEKEVWRYLQTVWIQCTNVTDGHTDGQTHTGRQQRPSLRIASRGKKRRRCFVSCLTTSHDQRPNKSLTLLVKTTGGSTVGYSCSRPHPDVQRSSRWLPATHTPTA